MRHLFTILLIFTLVVVFYLAWSSRDQFCNVSVTPVAIKCNGVALVKDLGRMGNKFFELLAAMIIAERWNLHVCVTNELKEAFVRYFSGFAKRYSVQLCHDLHHDNITDVHLKDYDPGAEVDCDHNITISGYPLDIIPELWAEIFRRQKELAAEFQWRPQLTESVRLQMSGWTHNGTRTAIGIHVRRKDYERHLNIIFGPSRLAGLDYFRRAMDHFRRKFNSRVFIVVSNDMDWCRTNLQAEDVVFAGRGWEEDPGTDLALLSACDHLILTYGSYGMMAAYFNSGEVIAAYNFTSQVNNLVERVRSLNMPNWHWFPA